MNINVPKWGAPPTPPHRVADPHQAVKSLLIVGDLNARYDSNLPAEGPATS
jgi:hypothetical protein